MSWKNSITRALTAKGKLKYIFEDQADYEEGTNEYQKWKRIDCLVTNWILNSVSKELAEAFTYFNSAAKIWKALEHRFCESNGSMLFKIKRDINLLEQGDCTVLQYFNKLKRMWDEILILRPIPRCKCGAARNCDCNAFSRIAEQDQEDKLILFLMGLNSCYEIVTNQILVIDSLPSLDKAYSLIYRVEKQSEISSERAMEMISYSAVNFSSSYKVNDPAKESG